MQDKYHFNMTKELEEDEIDMCNIGTATLLKGAQGNKIDIAIKMLQRGKYTIEEIVDLTELPLETVQKLAEEVAAAE